jgi:PAS domain S-box-containing protein
MFDKEFLKTLTVLYVEDDPSIRNSLGAIFEKVFKEVVVATDGQDGLDKYSDAVNNRKIDIDAIISDINMPKKNGLEMIGEIRNTNTEVPAILTTAHGETDFLMEAIKVNVSYYALKPINTPELLENIQKFCLAKHQQKLLLRQEQELSSYIGIIDHVATIAKIDNDGKFSDVNELFCVVSGYSESELLDMNILDITHGDVSKTTHQNMINSVKSGQNWEGLYKCIDKDNNTFYLRISAIIELDKNTDSVSGCVIIGFIATEDEKERRDTMQKVRQNIIEQKMQQSQLKKKINQLESTQKQLIANQKNNDIGYVRESLDRCKNNNLKLKNQLSHYENDISRLETKLANIGQTELSKRQELVEKNKKLQKEIETLTENLIHTQNRLNKYEGKKI